MKIATFILLVVSPFAQGAEDLAPGVLYPRTTGAWTTLADSQGTPPIKEQTAAEVTPGHFYLLQPVKGKHLTALYHTTQPDSFNVANSKVNVSALHLVAEFPVTEARLINRDGHWHLAGKTTHTGAIQECPITWTGTDTISPREHQEKTIRVALFDDYGSFGKGVPRCTELLSKADNMTVTLVKPPLIREGGLKDFDVVVFTGGSGGKQAATLGVVGREQVRRFIEAGGGYVGICAGNYLACDGFSWGLKVLDAKTKSSKWARGVGDVKIEFTPRGREILGMPEGLLDIRYANGPVFNPAGSDGIADFETLAWFRSELAENGSPKGAQTGSPAMVAGAYGQGRVLCSSPHPEQQPGMEAFIRHAVEWTAHRK